MNNICSRNNNFMRLDNEILCGSDFRAARVMADLSVAELAASARCGEPAIYRLEAYGPVRSSLGTVSRVLKALEEAGVCLLAENGRVRLERAA